MGNFEKLSVLVIVAIIVMILSVAISEWTGYSPDTKQPAPSSAETWSGELKELLQETVKLGEQRRLAADQARERFWEAERNYDKWRKELEELFAKRLGSPSVALGAKGEEAEMADALPEAQLAAPEHEVPPIALPAEPASAQEALVLPRLPLQYLRPRVMDLAVGSTAWINRNDLWSTPEGLMTVDPDTWTTTEADATDDIKVVMLTNGVRVDITTIPEKERRWIVSPRIPSGHLRVLELIDHVTPGPVAEPAAGEK